MTTTQKITLTTVKNFIKRNENNLLINVVISYDGMIDGCEFYNKGFAKAKQTTEFTENTKGIEGAWFVGSGRDYFRPFNENDFSGIEITNSCGRFILAIKN